MNGGDVLKKSYLFKFFFFPRLVYLFVTGKTCVLNWCACHELILIQSAFVCAYVHRVCLTLFFFLLNYLVAQKVTNWNECLVNYFVSILYPRLSTFAVHVHVKCFVVISKLWQQTGRLHCLQECAVRRRASMKEEAKKEKISRWRKSGIVSPS